MSTTHTGKLNPQANAASLASAPEDSVFDDILTPMERNVKTYLTTSMSKDLVELLAIMAVERPDDPHLWLANKLLERSPNGPFIAMKKGATLGKKGLVPAEQGEGGGSK